jgi:enoyl-CoA hydratase
MSTSGAPPVVSVERDGAVAVVRMNRPKANAISPDLVDAIAAAVEGLGQDASVRCIVIASAIERFFMAGADIAMMAGGGMAATRSAAAASWLSAATTASWWTTVAAPSG